VKDKAIEYYKRKILDLRYKQKMESCNYFIWRKSKCMKMDCQDCIIYKKRNKNLDNG